MDRILYAYILTVDNGQSPCYDNGVYTLACCKPQIRRIILQDWKNKIEKEKAVVWTCGLRRDTKTKKLYIVYLAKIKEIIKLEDYYNPNNIYSKRNDCYYRNVHTIYDENGNLPVSLSSEEIRKHCPHLYALDKNEHGKLDEEETLSYNQCCDIHGGSVLLSEDFIHCSCYKDNLELNEKLSPAFEDYLEKIKPRTQGHWHDFSLWNEFDNVIQKIDLGMHTDVKPLDASASSSKENNSCKSKCK